MHKEKFDVLRELDELERLEKELQQEIRTLETQDLTSMHYQLRSNGAKKATNAVSKSAKPTTSHKLTMDGLY